MSFADLVSDVQPPSASASALPASPPAKDKEPALELSPTSSVGELVDRSRRMLEKALEEKLKLARNGRYTLTAEEAQVAVECAARGEIPRELGMALGFVFCWFEAGKAVHRSQCNVSKAGGELEGDDGKPASACGEQSSVSLDICLVESTSGQALPVAKDELEKKKNRSLLESLLALSPDLMVGVKDVFCARAQILAPLKEALGPSWAEVEELMGAKHDLRFTSVHKEGPTLGSLVAPDVKDPDLSPFWLDSLLSTSSEAKAAKPILKIVAKAVASSCTPSGSFKIAIVLKDSEEGGGSAAQLQAASVSMQPATSPLPSLFKEYLASDAVHDAALCPGQGDSAVAGDRGPQLQPAPGLGPHSRSAAPPAPAADRGLGAATNVDSGRATPSLPLSDRGGDPKSLQLSSSSGSKAAPRHRPGVLEIDIDPAASTFEAGERIERQARLAAKLRLETFLREKLERARINDSDCEITDADAVMAAELGARGEIEPALSMALVAFHGFMQATKMGAEGIADASVRRS
eukprot:tig00021072_g17975.t1